NLEEVNAFPGHAAGADDSLLKYKIVRDGSLPLHVGGALTANFPPVFSNARINTFVNDRPASFLVTDGGAVENRGIISLLYGLESALNSFSKPAYQCRLPDIHVIVAEASASSIDYQNVRGLETALSGSLPVAHQLFRELTDQIQAQYRSLGSACDGHDRQMVVHYLPMPRVFRTRGGLGTHWMMPDTARFANPAIADKRKAGDEAIELDQASVEALLVTLHSNRLACSELLDEEARPLCDWIARDPHADRWRELLERLR
ncbi:MAG: hypothetical protein HUJ31_05600, partial [Pseudomonadales bacterium]|nr:hypothetical protein [Pseudomonadales bacterium]